MTAQAARHLFPCHAPRLSTRQPGATRPQPRIGRSSLSPDPRQAQSPLSLAPPAQPLPQPRTHQCGQDPRTGLRAPAHPKLSWRLLELPDCPRCLLPPPGRPRPGTAGKPPHGSAQLAREDPGPWVSLLTREQLCQVRSLPPLVFPPIPAPTIRGPGITHVTGHGVTCPFQKAGWTGHSTTTVHARWSCHTALCPWGQAGSRGTTRWPSAHLQSSRTQTPTLCPWSSLLSRTQGPSPLSLAASLPALGHLIAPSDPALSSLCTKNSHSLC